MNRLNCSTNGIGLLNPSANPDEYQNLHCPCNSGYPVCPANSTQGELYKYLSISYDEFFDMNEKNISTWILKTHDELKDLRFAYLI